MKGFETNTQLGKKDGRKYYRMKGVDGIVSSKINEGMGARVKNDAAYANTRLNNAEFGAAGSTAGALVRAMSQSWRYILLPFATGKLAKDVRAFMMQDSTNPWGQRGLTGTNWQAALAQRVSEFSKNDVGEYEGLTYSCVFNSTSGVKTHAEADTLKNAFVQSKGADGVFIQVTTGSIVASKYDSQTKAFAKAINDFNCAVEEDFCSFGDGCIVNHVRADHKETAQTSDKLIGGIVVILPYKEVNGSKYIMQELASFKMLAATAA